MGSLARRGGGEICPIAWNLQKIEISN